MLLAKGKNRNAFGFNQRDENDREGSSHFLHLRLSLLKKMFWPFFTLIIGCKPRETENTLKFQRSLFLRITTLLSWLKSTLWLKIKCFGTTIYVKTQCLQTNETQHSGKGQCLRSRGWSRERAVLIKSLIYARRGCQIKLKM